MAYEHLKLENQFCFPVYATSRLITKAYQPHLSKLDITYPQYLVLLVLWEQDELTVNAISQKLLLKSNTITPLLKRMEKQQLIIRQRSAEDERRVIVKLTENGKLLKDKASLIPKKIATKLLNNHLSTDDLIRLKGNLDVIIESLSEES